MGYEVAEIGSFYVGGRTAILRGLPRVEAPVPADPNGEVSVESMYVQFVRLARPRGRFPLMLWHGGGLTGSTYETKPDGNPGWQHYFLSQGWDVYLSDAVERGRSGWARYPEIWNGEPYFRTHREAWENFRIGPPGSYDPDSAKRRSLPGLQFPVEAFDRFGKYAVPRWHTNTKATQRAYDAYVRAYGPCIVLGHSQGAGFAYQAALNSPEMIKAIIIDEGMPQPQTQNADLSAVKEIPHLFLYGDFIEGNANWESMRGKSRRYADRLSAAGGSVDFYDLPELGIRGNSHMNMMDRNSDEIAALIQTWLESKGLVS